MGLYTSRSNRGWLADKSVKEGGWQIEYGDEQRRIHEIFEADLAKHGVVCKMKAFIPWCTGEVGPSSERETKPNSEPRSSIARVPRALVRQPLLLLWGPDGLLGLARTETPLVGCILAEPTQLRLEDLAVIVFR